MLLEIATCIVITASTQACGAGESVFSWESRKRNHLITVNGSIGPSLLYSKDVESAISDDFGLVPEINGVAIERADGNLLVWIASDHPTREIRERIFQKQFDLIDAFPELSFDFNIVSVDASDKMEPIATGAKMIFSR